MTLNKYNTIFLSFLIIVVSFLLTEGAPTGDAYLFAARASLDKITVNYHIGHTITLWPIYHILPSPLNHSLRPAGFVSLIFGITNLFLLYRLGKCLNYSKERIFSACMIYCCTPAAIYWSIVGEQYALQLTMNLLFVIAILKNRYFISTLLLIAAAVVSPIAVFGSSLIFLDPKVLNKVRPIALVVIISGLSYLLLTYFMGIDLTRGMNNIATESENFIRFYMINLTRLLAIILINFGVIFAYYIFNKKYSIFRIRHLNYAFVFFPFVILAMINTVFTMQLGSFMLPFFAAIALYLSSYLPSFKVLISHAICSVIIAYFLLIVPGNQIIDHHKSAANSIKSMENQPTMICGHWDNAFPISIEYSNWNIPGSFAIYSSDTNCSGNTSKNFLSIINHAPNIIQTFLNYITSEKNLQLPENQNYGKIYTCPFFSVINISSQNIVHK